MSLHKIMTNKIVTVEMDDPLNVVKDIFDHVSFHHLLVVEGETLMGVISDRDLFKALSPNLGTAAETAKDLQCLNRKAHQIMSRQPITLLENDKVYTAVEVFNKEAVSCIPIVNEENKPIGIVSWRDILKAVTKSHDRGH